MGALNDAFKLPSDKDLQRLKRLQSSKKILPEVVIRTYFSKADYVTIFQALVMPPVFNEYGIDINEELRKKAAYSITILADEQQDRVGEIINFLLNTTVESQLSQKQAFISREAFQALGEISKKNPAKVLDRLLEVLPESDMLMKRYILETISIIGENEANTLRILGKRSIQEMLKGKSFEIRNAGIQALVSMGSNLSDISVILEKIYQILDSGRELNEKGKQLTESFEEDEYILEMALASMLKIVPQGPNKVQIQKILPFLYFKCHSKDEDTDNYILFNSLKILAYLAYYFPDQLPLNDIKIGRAHV